MRTRTGIKSRTKRVRFAHPVGDPGDSRGLYAAMRRFLEHRGAIGHSERTLCNLERHLRSFIAWADARSVTHPQHVTRPVLERYQRWLYHYRKKDGMPLSIDTRRVMIVPLRSFFKWLTRAGEIDANPASEIDLPRKTQRLPRHVLSAGEVERVLAQPDTSTVLGLRDRAILEVLYATGMRRIEVSRLQIGDIDDERAVVLIREGKGRRDRLIPMGERALHWVRQYLDHSRSELAWNHEDRTLFLSMEGFGLSVDWLTKIATQHIKKADLNKSGACHLFRHTMATLMLENGADIRFIQAILGHADLATTQIYTQVAIKQLQKVHQETHPGANRRIRNDQMETDDPDQPDADITTASLLAALDAEGEDEESQP